MKQLVITARLRLLLTSEGGREAPIQSGYRPQFDFGGTWMGRPSQNTGSILLLDGEQLAPGEVGLVSIEPMSPEFTGPLGIGSIFPVQEGSHLIGHATVQQVVRGPLFTPEIATFVCRAREFCSFAEEANKLSLQERIVVAREQLVDLYAAALRLPSVDPSPDSKDHASPAPPLGWVGFEQHEIYWEVFDPYKQDELVAGSLSDDILDVYRDILRGLRMWDDHADADAIWEWRFLLGAHWGDHAVDALRALQRIRE